MKQHLFIIGILYTLLSVSHGLAIKKDENEELKPPSRDQFLVKELPGLTKNIKEDDRPLMYSGQLELYSENNTYYYFWKYIDQHKIAKAQGKTFFWLNGGPGCSSMDGALMEAGPFRINSQKEITYNNGSWHKSGDIVFVDQPSGTGFSYSDVYDASLPEVVQHFLRFLDKYFEVFPEDIDNEIYLSGESYAGQYIPYIARGILDRNKQPDSQKINLKSLLIGNGWIAPNEQSLSYLPYSHNAGILTQSNPEWSNILRQHDKCQNIVNKVNAGEFGDQVNVNSIISNDCESVLNMILSATLDKSLPANQQCYNMYDYTLKDSYPSCGMNWPPDLAYVSPFLNNPTIMEELNVFSHKHWRECTGKVGQSLKNRGIEPAVKLLPSILEEIPILLFHGNRDIICNYLGAESFIKNMEWNGVKGFGDDVESVDWLFENEVVGYIKSARNLTFVNVFDASHMVPFDKPFVSRSLIDLADGEFDEIVSKDGKNQISTYELGKSKLSKPDESISAPSVNEEVNGTPTDSRASSSSSSTPEDSSISSTSSRITRLIQLLVILILIWGIYVLYSSYKSRPSSIIKTRPSSGKKKNVQWADQLRQFQEDDVSNEQNTGFLSKAYQKITGGDANGAYVPTPERDIEMGNLEADLSNFELHSDEEEEEEQTQLQGASQQETAHLPVDSNENDKNSAVI